MTLLPSKIKFLKDYFALCALGSLALRQQLDWKWQLPHQWLGKVCLLPMILRRAVAFFEGHDENWDDEVESFTYAHCGLVDVEKGWGYKKGFCCYYCCKRIFLLLLLWSSLSYYSVPWEELGKARGKQGQTLCFCGLWSSSSRFFFVWFIRAIVLVRRRIWWQGCVQHTKAFAFSQGSSLIHGKCLLFCICRLQQKESLQWWKTAQKSLIYPKQSNRGPKRKNMRLFWTFWTTVRNRRRMHICHYSWINKSQVRSRFP